MPIFLALLSKYWKPLVIVLGALLVLGYFRQHYIHLGEARSEARYAQAARELAKMKEKATAQLDERNKQIADLTTERDRALEAARKTPAVLTKIVTKVMHEGETCTDHDIGPDFERVWNDAAKAGSDKPVP